MLLTEEKNLKSRRGFLTQLFTTVGGIVVAPSIVTHGLKLRPVCNYPLALELVDNSWTEADMALYAKLPYYFAKVQIERQRTQYKTWSKMMKSDRWNPNMGNTERPILT